MDKRLIGDAKPFTASIAKELGVIGRMKLRHFPHERSGTGAGPALHAVASAAWMKLDMLP